MSLKTKLTLAVITEKKSKWPHLAPALTKMGYSVRIYENRQSLADDFARNVKVDIVLINWGLHKDNVVTAYNEVMQKYNLPCLVFSEDLSRTTNNALLKSRIPNVIFPPLSAESVHRRVQMLIRGSQKAEPIEKADRAVIEKREKTLQSNVTKILDNIPESQKPNPQTAGKVFAIQLMWGDNEGYLMLGCADKEGKWDPAEIQKHLAKALQELGEVEVRSENAIEIEIDFNHFHDWAKEYAQVVASDKRKENHVLVTFSNIESLPNMSRQVSEDFVWVDLVSRLLVNTKLTFDVFIHLPTNEKFVLYLRRDTVVSETTLSRFSKVPNDRSFISPADCGNLFNYCIMAKPGKPDKPES